MSTEITTWNQTPNHLEIIESTQDRAVARLADWAQSADAAFGIAAKLVQSSFVPEGFKGKPVEAAAAILAGLEVGLQPMAALRSFDVIQGQAAPRAITLRAIVQSYGHDIEVLESNETRCRMRGRRRGSQDWQTVTWTLDRAKKLGLTGKANWRNQPQSMLVARATSEICRLVAADAILGIAYTAEEIQDGATQDAQPVAEAATAPRRVMQRKPKAEPVEEPTAEEAPADDVEPEGITQKQLTALNAALTGMGMSDRGEKLAWLTESLNRDITSSKDLTKDEASRLIDYIATADGEVQA